MRRDRLFAASAETMIAIAADPRHLGARIGITSVLHTWGSALTPPSPCSHDRTGRRHRRRRIAMGPVQTELPCARQGARASVPRQVLGHAHRRPFRRPIEVLQHPCRSRRQANLQEVPGSAARTEWVVYCKQPFAGPEQVLRYLARYTHRVAISNRRLVAADDGGVSFRWKDYRIEGPGRWKTMTLTPHEFIRRFLIHVLPKGFHRIRHYGLLASGRRAANIARARNLLAAPPPSQPPDISTAVAIDQPRVLPRPCPCCGGRMFIIETFASGSEPKHRPTPVPAAIRIDTS